MDGLGVRQGGLAGSLPVPTATAWCHHHCHLARLPGCQSHYRALAEVSNCHSEPGSLETGPGFAYAAGTAEMKW